MLYLTNTLNEGMQHSKKTPIGVSTTSLLITIQATPKMCLEIRSIYRCGHPHPLSPKFRRCSVRHHLGAGTIALAWDTGVLPHPQTDCPAGIHRIEYRMLDRLCSVCEYDWKRANAHRLALLYEASLNELERMRGKDEWMIEV